MYNGKYLSFTERCYDLWAMKLLRQLLRYNEDIITIIKHIITVMNFKHTHLTLQSETVEMCFIS